MTGGRELRKEIVELLVNLPAAYDPNGRKAFLLRSGLDEVLREIDCTGAPSDFATRIVVQLYQFGSLQRGQHALDALLEGLKNHVGLDRQAEIETLRERLRVHLADLEALGLKSYIGTDGDFVSAEEIQKSVYQFLEAIENEFKYVPIFHPPHKIVLQDQYIPIEVTLERRYRHAVETTWGYAEGEAEFARAYAMKGSDEMREETRRVQVPWQEARKKHKRLIVLADPGMGKTALLKMEAVLGAQASCLHNSPPGRGKGWVSEVIVPLFFRLSEFADTEEEIAETIPRLLQRNYPDSAPTILPLLSEKLKNGTCLLLLDALDEVPQEQRNHLSDKLNRFARYYPSCPIIVTSRIVGYGGGILYDAKEVEIVPFSRKQIEQYIEIWFKNLESDRMNRINRIEENENNPVHPVNPVKTPDPKGLIHELQQKPQIRGLAQNPLLLSLLCSLYQEDELTLPARRVQIYEQAVHYMLYDWRRVSERRFTEKALTDAAWVEAKLELLEHLAYQFSCEYKEMFSMRELLTKIEECKCGTALKHHDSPDIIKELSQEDGIIQQLDGQGPKTRYIFLHRTFQEYLTASYLKHHPDGIELAKAHFWDFDWHETLILFAGLANEPETFLNTLLTERDDIFHTLLLLAGKCLAECPQLNMPELIDRLYKVWRHPLYHEFAEPTVVAVGQTHQQMLTHLLTGLHDTNWDVRSKVAGVLGKIGDARAVEDLLTTLHAPYRGDRSMAAEVLGQIGDTRAIGGLLVALHDADRDVGWRAAEALGQIGDIRAIGGLLVALHDADRDVGWRAAKALGEIGDMLVIDDLLTALYEPDNEVGSVRRAVARALKKIGNGRAVDSLLNALHDTDRCVRSTAAEALGEIGDTRAIGGLLVALHDADRCVRSMAAKALGEIGDTRAIGGLLTALHDTDWNVKLMAVRALGEIGDARAVEGLLIVLHDVDGPIDEAVEALGKIGSTRAVEGLLTALRDLDEYTRYSTAKVLGEIGDARAVEGLLTALYDTAWYVRWRAVEALGKIGDARAVESLLTVLYDPTDIGFSALVALGEIGDVRALENLLVALHDRENAIRREAAVALGKIGDVRAKEALLATLSDPNSEVRSWVVTALEKIGGAGVVEGLLASLHDADSGGWGVRREAAEALGRIGTLEVLEKLLHKLDIDIYDMHILPIVRQLAIKFSRQHSRPACLPVYPQPRLLRWLRKGLWRGRIFLNTLRQKMR